ncbi:hypothetical protein [Methylomonas koyamae]|uniref:hypothetical protein n=1 Tax=Methylomonas koyamae TaxID=702114 RepID=UPI00112E166E|nr:hypothetical protein [Methylomonas koyamae]TPQ24916.1 hypothetical protein C2U68_17210 [Methylomonas koyamae]
MTDRYLHAIWCDDIRLEVGNKPSFMGVYIGGMQIPAAPFVLSKLCCQLWATTPIDKPFRKADIKISFDNGTVVGNMVMDDPAEAIESLDAASVEARTFIMNIGMNIIGLEIPENCRYLAVTMETESETLEGPKLMISVAPSPA